MNISGLLQGLAGFAWFGLIGVVVMIFIRASRNQPAKGLNSLVVVLLVAAVILTAVGAGLVYVQPEERGVVFSAFAQGGLRKEALDPGVHLIIPFIEQVRTYPISRQTYTMSATTGEGNVAGDDSIRARTNDGQEVFIEASVIFSIDPTEIISLHITWQDRYTDELVRPTVRGIIRDVTSQFGVEEIVSTQRTVLEEQITALMETKFKENNLILVDFVLRDIHFSEEYALAVEQKQIAEQQSQQAKFVVESKKQEAEQARQVAQGAADAAVIAAQGAAEARLIQAAAEAEANQLIAQSITDELVQYQYVLKLAPGVETIFIPSGNQFILPLPNTTTPSTTTP
ncbi:MAG: prohibitin family protein [Anaerolineales bacterium]|nr:prohibitin family protein [Anaerolineales bacterium]